MERKGLSFSTAALASDNTEVSHGKIVGILNTVDKEGIPVKIVTTKDSTQGVQEQKVYASEDRKRIGI